MLITIRNGKAELRNDNGGLVRTMGSSNGQSHGNQRCLFHFGTPSSQTAGI